MSNAPAPVLIPKPIELDETSIKLPPLLLPHFIDIDEPADDLSWKPAEIASPSGIFAFEDTLDIPDEPPGVDKAVAGSCPPKGVRRSI